MAARYTFKFRHDEKSLVALSHMQYDLFCQRNYLARSVVAVAVIILAINFIDRWWAYLLIVYGAFLLTGKYNSSNHTANKLIANIKASKLPFPCSRFEFTSDRIIITPEPKKSDEDIAELSYSAIERLGEDANYFYFFRDRYGGYMIPKDKFINDEKRQEFRDFIENKCSQNFMRKSTAFGRLRNYMKKKQSEPYHL